MMKSISVTRLTFRAKALLAVSVVLLASFALQTGHAAALSGSQFRAGDIIDDSLFFNSSSMNVQQIQNFLNSKVPVCDTNGTQMYNSTMTRAQYGASKGYPAPYTCLKDYSQSTPSLAAESGLCNAYTGGTKSSAQIIYDVAQACGISPKVLIVLLQKEQSLVTDDWPWSIEYRSATGFGCPDTSACDSTYYGFFNQVYNAARIYRKYQLDASSYNYRAGRNNIIQYNPSSSCGSSSVYIQNQATADLYIYTPYQPNQAALNNLYGTGDSCSAYGNRNFWRLYNDWFGQSWGSLIRTPDDGSLFYTDGTQRFFVGSMQLVADYGWSSADVRIVSQAERDAIPLATSPYSSNLGMVVKSNDDSDADGGAIYLITRGFRVQIPSMQMFSDYGFTASDITYLPLNDIMQIIPGSNYLTNFAVGTDGSVYKIAAGQRQRYFDMATVNRDAAGTALISVSDMVTGRLPYGNAVVDGDAVFTAPDGSLRLYQNGNSFTIGDMRIFNCYNLSAVPVIHLPSYDSLGSTNLGNLSCLVHDSQGTNYLMAGTTKYIIPASWGLSPSLQVADATINRVPGTTTAPSVLRRSDGNLSIVENGTRRHIPSMEVFSALGFGSNDILPVDDLTFDSIPAGPDKFTPGSVLLNANGAISVVTSSSQSIHVPTMEMFNDYGFNKALLYPVTSSVMDAYPNTSDTLYNDILLNGTPTLLDSGRSFALNTTDLQTAYGVSATGLPSVIPELLTHVVAATPSRFIRPANGSAIYYMDNGQKRYVGSWQTVVDMGGQNSIVPMSPHFIDSTPTGSPL